MILRSQSRSELAWCRDVLPASQHTVAQRSQSTGRLNRDGGCGPAINKLKPWASLSQS